MNIRRAQARDLEAVDRLLSQVLTIHAELRPDLFLPGTRKYTDSELLAIFADECSPVFVAEDADGAVLGYCFCQLQERRGLNNMPDGRELYIDDLCVWMRPRAAGTSAGSCTSMCSRMPAAWAAALSR